MRGYLVDTNIPSELTREQPDERVTAFIRQAGQQNLFLSVMTIGEIRKGVDGLALSRKRSELEACLEIDVRNWFMGRILPVTEAIAERRANWVQRRKEAASLSQLWMGVIAATALEHDLTVVTRNVRHFEPLGVDVLNPWEST